MTILPPRTWAACLAFHQKIQTCILDELLLASDIEFCYGNIVFWGNCVVSGGSMGHASRTTLVSGANAGSLCILQKGYREILVHF